MASQPPLPSQLPLPSPLRQPATEFFTLPPRMAISHHNNIDHGHKITPDMSQEQLLAHVKAKCDSNKYNKHLVQIYDDIDESDEIPNPKRVKTK